MFAIDDTQEFHDLQVSGKSPCSPAVAATCVAERQ